MFFTGPSNCKIALANAWSSHPGGVQKNRFSEGKNCQEMTYHASCSIECQEKIFLKGKFSRNWKFRYYPVTACSAHGCVLPAPGCLGKPHHGSDDYGNWRAYQVAAQGAELDAAGTV